MEEASSPVHNPRRTFIENVISGDNYFRSSEYRELLEELDGLYADREGLLTALGSIVGALEVLGDHDNLVRIGRAAISKATASAA